MFSKFSLISIIFPFCVPYFHLPSFLFYKSQTNSYTGLIHISQCSGKTDFYTICLCLLHCLGRASIILQSTQYYWVFRACLTLYKILKSVMNSLYYLHQSLFNFLNGFQLILLLHIVTLYIFATYLLFPPSLSVVFHLYF